VGPRTLELGPEPPAVVNFLVNDFRVTDDAVPDAHRSCSAQRRRRRVARPDVYIRSEKWRTRFENEVVADAQRRGLSREALDSVVVMALTAAAIVPGLLAWSVWEFEAGLGTATFAGSSARRGPIRLGRHDGSEALLRP
jgi:hypothetical protein